MSWRSERMVWLVVVLVAGMAGLGLAAAWALGDGSRGDVTLVLFLTPLAALGRLFPIQIAFRRRMVTDVAPLFASALLLPPLTAGVVTLTAIAVAEYVTARRRSEIDARQLIFNSSQAALAVMAAATVVAVGASEQLPSQDDSVLLGVFLGAVAMLVVTDVLVFSVIWAQTGLRFRRMVGDFIRGRNDLPYDLALYGAGFVAAVLGARNPWLLTVMAVPLPVLHRAMRNQVALKLQTREACIAFADIVDARDAYTFGHCKRVSEFAEELCREIGLPVDMTEEISLAARIHDLGKIGIRDNVLLKPARLSTEEFCHMREHAELGARLTAFLPEFKDGTRYIRHHHEKWDGSGYPDGLRGNDIPLGARIIAVADTFDAITSTRVYREGLPDGFAQQEMARVAGTQLDPAVTRAWFRCRGWPWPEEALLEMAPEAIVNELALPGKAA